MTTATVEEVQESTVDEMLDVEGAPEGTRDATEYEHFFAVNPLGVLELEPSEIIIDPNDNGRYHTAKAGDKKLKELVASIERNGQETPVKVRLNAHGNPVLCFGFRRYAAIETINAERKKGDRIKVQAMLLQNKSEDSNDLNAFSANIRENVQRENLTPIDLLKAFERFAAPVEEGGFGLNQKETGDRVGVSRATVNMYLNNLSPLSDASKDLIHVGKVSASVAIELMQSKTFTPEQVDAELKKLADGVQKEGKKASVREVRSKTRQKAEKTGKGTTKQRTTKEIVADLSAEAEGEAKGVVAVKAALLKYVKGASSYATFMKKIAEVV